MYCLVNVIGMTVGVMDTSDEVVEEYDLIKLEKLCKQNGIRVAGIDDASRDKITDVAHACDGVDCSYLEYNGFHVIAVTYMASRDKYVAGVLVYDSKGKLIRAKKLATLPRYIQSNIWINPRDNSCNASFMYTDKHHYGEDREEEFVLYYTLSFVNGKLSEKWDDRFKKLQR